jgi:type I restriction enzyme, S subunit
MTPEGWRKTTYGQAMTEAEQRAEGAIALPVLSVTKTRGPMLASERFGKVMHGRDLGKYRVAPRDYVVADPMLLWDGSIGLQTVVDAGLVSPDYRVYKPAPEIDPKFLGYLVRSPLMLPHYQGGARGTNVRRNRIARSDFLAIPVGLPPRGEQKKIAAILSSVDEAIQATQAVIAQLQIVKKAMMAELLTKGLPGRHTRFKQTEIGAVPEDWAVVQLGDVIKKGPENGLYKPQSDYGTGTAIIRIDAFDNGDRLRCEGLRLVRVSDDEIARFKLHQDDILINRVNSLSHLAKTALVTEPSQDTVFESNMMRLAVDGSKACPTFMFRVVASPASKAFFLSRAKQAVAQASVNQRDVRSLPVPLPNLREQNEIAVLLDSVDDRLGAEMAQAAGLLTTKTALMSVLLTGEVRVKPDEDAT